MSKELPKPKVYPDPPTKDYRVKEYLGKFTVEKWLDMQAEWKPVYDNGTVDRITIQNSHGGETIISNAIVFNNLAQASDFIVKLRRGAVYHEV